MFSKVKRLNIEDYCLYYIYHTTILTQEWTSSWSQTTKNVEKLLLIAVFNLDKANLQNYLEVDSLSPKFFNPFSLGLKVYFVIALIKTFRLFLSISLKNFFQENCWIFALIEFLRFLRLNYLKKKFEIRNPIVNFINILRTNFSYERCFGSFSLVTCM